MTAKPTVAELGIDPEAQTWQRSGPGDGAIEVAFAQGWVLMRVAADPGQRVLVFDKNEWECFLDGARNGEFDNAAAPEPTPLESWLTPDALTPGPRAGLQPPVGCPGPSISGFATLFANRNLGIVKPAASSTKGSRYER